MSACAWIYRENRYFLCVFTAPSPEEPQGFSALQICCVYTDFQLPQDVLGELERCRRAAGMGEVISFPSPGSGVQGRQSAPVLGAESFPGTGGRQSREKTPIPGFGGKNRPPLSPATLLWLVGGYGDT